MVEFAQKITPEDIDLLPYPAFFMDEDRFLIKRNQMVKPSIISLRVGARIDHYVSTLDRKRIMELPVNKEIYIDLMINSSFGALIKHLENGYLLALRNITAHMMRFVSDLAISIPTFFGNVSEQIESLRLSQYPSKEEMARVRHRYQKVLRGQFQIAKYFERTSGRYDRDSVSEITVPINYMVEDAAKILRPNGTILICNLCNQNTFIRASVEDARYAAASLLAIAAENTYNGRVKVDSYALDNEYFYKVMFEPRLDDHAYQALLLGYYGGEVLQSAFGSLFFDLLLVQMLAEGSGWRFSVRETGCSHGVVSLSLIFPLADEQPMLLNCPPDSLPLLEMLFANILGPQEDDESATT